jgi:nucleotide-binding universal stress UspA family protein
MDQGKQCENVILAIDGSEHSNSALNLLYDLELSPQCLVTALSVLDTPHTPRRQFLLAALEHTRMQLEERKINVRTGILHGHPAHSLIEYADEHKPDVIIFGAKGRRATLGILLGGVAQQLVEHSHWPVLVVRSPYNGINQIVLVTDGSENGKRALDLFIRFPFNKRAVIHLIHVISPLTALDPEIIAQTWPMGAEIIQPVTPEMTRDLDAYLEEEERKGEQILAAAVNNLKEHGIQVKKSLLRGDAASEILNFAQNIKADLIVAGSRGLSQVQGWLLGSVSRKIVHYAKCSVLIAKE